MLGNSVNVIPILKARYIGRPLLHSLTKNSFTGSVVGIYQDFCNILGNDGRMITIAISPMGKSPFSVLIEWQDSFTSILAKMNVRADQFGIKVGVRFPQQITFCVWIIHDCLNFAFAL